MPSDFLRALLLSALLVAWGQHFLGAEGGEIDEAHQKMLNRLDEVAAETEKDNPFLGSQELRKFQSRYGRLRVDTPLGEQFYVTIGLANRELNLGMERESIAHFEEAIKITEGGKTLTGIDPNDFSRVVKTLAIACLRLAETENCCAQPSPESCIFPLQGAAIHAKDEGSRKAIFYLKQLLTNFGASGESAGDAIWLLNLAYMTLGEHPDGVPEKWRISPLRESGPMSWAKTGEKFPAFLNVAEAAGVDTFSLAGGASADDFDGDSDFDILVTSWDPQISAKFFENDGTGKFKERDAGLEGIRGGLNLKQADYDNDGDLDVLILRGAWLWTAGRHPNSLLRNDGHGHFTDVTFEVGLAEPSLPTQTAEWMDYDLDGDLDLFIGNESFRGFQAPCQLFRNDDGQFTDVALAAGLAVESYIKGVTWGDYDGDRYPDLFLSSLGGPNLLFRNRGDGTFANESESLGETAGPLRSFPTWFFDYNNDGWLDLLVHSYRCSGSDYIRYYTGKQLPEDRIPALFRNDSGKGFTNVTRETWLDRPTLPMGSNFGDLTNTGFLDIYLGAGDPSYDSIFPNTLLINDRGRFSDLTQTSRMGHLQKGHAVSFADLDRDGDLDVFEQMGGALAGDGYFDALFRNPGFDRNWISVRLFGTRSNSFGIGSRVRVVTKTDEGEEDSSYQWMSSGGSFGSNPLELHFGIGKATRIQRIEVFWPTTGKTQTILAPPINERIEIVEEDSGN